MTNENKDPKKDKSWLKEEIDELKEEANNDNEFPLSGANGPNVVHDHHEDDEDDEEEDSKKSSFLNDLDTEFPLSGGEEEDEK